MNKRRMFSANVIESDEFLKLKPMTQLLYVHISLDADDKGMVNGVERIVKMLGARPLNLAELVDKGWLISFSNGVYAITHWNQNNCIAPSKCRNTVYLKEYNQLRLTENSEYITKESAKIKGLEHLFADNFADNFADKTAVQSKVSESKVKENKRKESKVSESNATGDQLTIAAEVDYTETDFSNPVSTATDFTLADFRDAMRKKVLKYAQQEQIPTSRESVLKFINFNIEKHGTDFFVDSVLWHEHFSKWAKKEKGATAYVGSEHFNNL